MNTLSKMKHLLKPIRHKIEISILVIKTAIKPKGPGFPSKRPFSSLFEVGKQITKTIGIYNRYELWRYDPDYLYKKTIGKYTYKPRKRITGHALSTRGFLKKAPFSYSKFGKTHSRWNTSSYDNKCRNAYSKSGYCS